MYPSPPKSASKTKSARQDSALSSRGQHKNKLDKENETPRSARKRPTKTPQPTNESMDLTLNQSSQPSARQSARQTPRQAPSTARSD